MNIPRTYRSAGVLALVCAALGAGGCTIALAPAGENEGAGGAEAGAGGSKAGGSEAGGGEAGGGEAGGGGGSTTPIEPELRFSQLDFDYSNDGEEYAVVDSPWAAVHIRYPTDAEAPLLFFNLEVDGEWCIRNVPLRSGSDPGELVELTLHFDLGVLPGTPIESLTYASTFTTIPLVTGPGDDAEDQLGPVADERVVIRSGLLGEYVFYAGVPIDDPLWFMWSDFQDFAFHPWKAIVNQDCGEAECFAAAISNSQKMLKKLHPDEMAGLSDDPNDDHDDTDIETIKPKTGWVETLFSKGAQSSDDTADPKACWNQKKTWTDGDDKYPIDTEIMDDPDGFDKVLDAIRDGKDVELVVLGHTVMVTGIVKLLDGRYILEIVHDTKQGEKGGTQTELVEYDTDEHAFHGSDFFEGQEFGQPGTGHPLFIIEGVK